MSPSFSSKRGVRYRFYVSRALRGRKQNAGTVTRVSAPEIEGLVATAVGERFNIPKDDARSRIERIVVSSGKITVTPTPGRGRTKPIEITWTPRARDQARIQVAAAPEAKPDQKLLRSIIRAHTWLNDLSSGRYASIVALAAAASIHPKVIRQGLRLAFLAPELTASALNERPLLSLKQIPKSLPLAWHQHARSDG